MEDDKTKDKPEAGPSSRAPGEKSKSELPSQVFTSTQAPTLGEVLESLDQFRKNHGSNVDKANLDLELSKLTDRWHGGECVEDRGFCAAVSRMDGTVQHTTDSLTASLGYPRGMLVGRSFLDYIPQEDQQEFCAQVTAKLSVPICQMHTEDRTEDRVMKTTGGFYCRLRSYNGLKSGFSVKERKTQYISFKLTLSFSRLCLYIMASPVEPAYATAAWRDGQFKTSHTTECKTSWVDDSTVAYTGFFPQHIINTDILSFFHPIDLHIVKEAFEAVIQSPDKPHHSKPVRLIVKNGCYITVSSIWTSFVNPLNKQLEFLVGRHKVLEAPKNIKVFDAQNMSLVDEMTAKDVKVKEDIKAILRESSKVAAVPKGHQKLTSVMGTLVLDETEAKASGQEEPARGQGLRPRGAKRSQPEAKSSSKENPPSYNQLTYHANLTRFFNSLPAHNAKRFKYGVDTNFIDSSTSNSDSEAGGTQRSLSQWPQAEDESLPSISRQGSAEEEEQGLVRGDTTDMDCAEPLAKAEPEMSSPSPQQGGSRAEAPFGGLQPAPEKEGGGNGKQVEMAPCLAIESCFQTKQPERRVRKKRSNSREGNTSSSG